MKLRTTGWAKPVENPEIQFKFHLYPHIIGFLLLLPAVYFFSCRGNIIMFSLFLSNKQNVPFSPETEGISLSLSLSLWFFFFRLLHISRYYKFIFACIYSCIYVCIHVGSSLSKSVAWCIELLNNICIDLIPWNCVFRFIFFKWLMQFWMFWCHNFDGYVWIYVNFDSHCLFIY